ncbi:Conserved_hypothetical protein [Hexamita inflata]|uniref:Uncharacterized protein n=1 Tax=Hexamita inflata TaxID=28002 RepID=A0AA86QLF9_9EUKA|nr:Conserved hypothetical protein [Hexamita inflata]CAI9960398.1 Conserved hypothetical protein [Hexamita inflata]
MKAPKTFKDQIKNKIDEKRSNDRQALDQSILGTINSSHLLYKDYNLDMNYIMRQRILEYQKERQKTYSQFVRGMVPENILDDLNLLEERQKADKQFGMAKKTLEKSVLDEQVEERLAQSRLNISGQLNTIQDVQQSDEEEEIEVQGLSKQQKKIKKLNNPAVNCIIYMRENYPEQFRWAQREYFGLK